MPYRTPDASQYTQIKRYQANLDGKLGSDPVKFRAPLSYSFFTPGNLVNTFPVNVLESNKFIEPAVSGPVNIILDCQGTDFSSGYFLSDPITFSQTTQLTISFTNYSNIEDCTTCGITKDGYDFTDTNLSVDPVINVINKILQMGNIVLQNNYDLQIFDPTSVITVVFPTPISSFDYINMNG